MSIYLTDDGTLDTVLKCDRCGEEFRFNYSPEWAIDGPEPTDGQNEAAYSDFVAESISEVEDEHTCPEPE